MTNARSAGITGSDPLRVRSPVWGARESVRPCRLCRISSGKWQLLRERSATSNSMTVGRNCAWCPRMVETAAQRASYTEDPREIHSILSPSSHPACDTNPTTTTTPPTTTPPTTTPPTTTPPTTTPPTTTPPTTTHSGRHAYPLGGDGVDSSSRAHVREYSSASGRIRYRDGGRSDPGLVQDHRSDDRRDKRVS